MAQITAVPLPALVERQIDLTSLLSAGLSIITSVFTDPNSGRTTLRTSASSATSTSDSTSSPTSSSSTSSSTQSSTSPSSTSGSTALAASSTASPTTSSGNHKSNVLPIVLGVVLGVVCLLFLLLLLCLCLRRRRKHGSFFRKRRSSPDLHSDGESTIGAGHTVTETKETSVTSSEPMSSPEAHHAGVAAPLAAAGITRYNDRDQHYPPIPAAHQMSSVGRRHSNEYAYVPDDPFADSRRGQLTPRERRSRHSLTLDPVREHPMRERSLSETRYPRARRWTAGSGQYRAPPSPSGSLGSRTIPRKPVGGVGSMSPNSTGQHADWPFEHRRQNARRADSGDFGIAPGGDASRFSRAAPVQSNPNRRFYSASNSSF